MGYITNSDLFEMLSSNSCGGHSFASQRYEKSTLFKDFALNKNMICREEETEKEEEPDASKPAMEAADEDAVKEEAAPFEAAEHDSPPGDEAETGPDVEQEQEPGDLES